MKSIFMILGVALLVTPALAQNKDTVGLNIPQSNGLIIYEGVVEVPGKTQKDLYGNARQWFVDHFVNSKEVIQTEDKDAGKIIGKGILPVFYKQLMTLELRCKMTMQIDCRDGKYRYKIYDMTLNELPSSYASGTTYIVEGFLNNLTGQKPDNAYSKGQSKKILTGFNTSLTNTITSLKKAMSAKLDTF